ncbi:MAG: type II toxin-antitoxin system RelE/ParE family toxin [Rhodospirillaceae bacterium]|nr:type II toxin-antitoxin system RelE/ParE family toxin [Rhodospirillaceae bacterium]
MPTAYRLTREARADLVVIARYSLQTWGKRQRAKYMGELAGHFTVLAQQPTIGRLRDDIAPDVRGFMHQPYVIFYRARRAGVEILRILHMARDVVRLMTNE